MEFTENQIDAMQAGGERRRELLHTGELFITEVERIKTERGIQECALNRAAAIVAYYGLDGRETDLIAIEEDFFLLNSSPETKRTYLKGYEHAAEAITFGVSEKLTEEGWLMRWGAKAATLELALRVPNLFTAERLLDGRAYNLRGVLFKQSHDEILQQNGIHARVLGLYPAN